MVSRLDIASGWPESTGVQSRLSLSRGLSRTWRPADRIRVRSLAGALRGVDDPGGRRRPAVGGAEQGSQPACRLTARPSLGGARRLVGASGFEPLTPAV